MGSRHLLTLTKNGHRFLMQTQRPAKRRRFTTASPNPARAITTPTSTGLIKKRLQRSKNRGGRNLRVVLDYELKKRLYHDLASSAKTAIPLMANTPSPRSTNFRSFAERFRTRCSNRIRNSRWRAGSRGPRTDHRSLSRTHLVEKVLAGFAALTTCSGGAPADDVSKLRRILDQRELTAEICRCETAPGTGRTNCRPRLHRTRARSFI